MFLDVSSGWDGGIEIDLGQNIGTDHFQAIGFFFRHLDVLGVRMGMIPNVQGKYGNPFGSLVWRTLRVWTDC